MDYDINVMKKIFTLPLETLSAAQVLAKKQSTRNLLIVSGLGLFVVGAIVGYKIAMAQYSISSHRASGDGGFRPGYNFKNTGEKTAKNKYSIKPIAAAKVV